MSDELPDGTVSAMPWRKAGVKYSQNEVYLDIVEELDAIVNVNGQVRWWWWWWRWLRYVLLMVMMVFLLLLVVVVLCR